VGGSRIEFGWMRWYLSVGSLIVMLVCPLHGQESRGLRFEVELEPSLPAQPPGRVLVVMAPSGRVEPRELIGRTGLDATPTVGVDAPRLAQGESVILDTSALAFPIESLADLGAGDHHVQAVFSTNRDIRSYSAPGSLYSEPRRISLNPLQEEPVRLTLNRSIPDDVLPAGERYLRFVKIQSDLLSEFHGRPIYLRAGIILPRGYEQEPRRRYPLRVHIGGYGSRYTEIRSMMRPGSLFSDAWLADNTPRMVLLHLDGAGPYGDPYQVNSANNGPYGEGVTQELIPYVEREFRGVGKPYARVLDGWSTGGWVSLALQIFYPEFFNGAWAFCPDSVDFRAFQLLDIYRDDSAYVDGQGNELAAAQNQDGSVRFTMRHEVEMENLLGFGGSWTTSGRQWGAWNATYGPRGASGLPVPLWDSASGRIDHSVTQHWEKYDLRLVIERNWDDLSTKLRSKLNIWVGEMDDYYLNTAVHLLDEMLQTRSSIDARVTYGEGRGHCWVGLSQGEIIREIGERVSNP